jgi:hypothetical protein
MKKSYFILCGLVAASVGSAQNNPAVTQADTTRLQRNTDQVMRDARPGDTLPSLYEEESEDIGPQTVLRTKKPTWVRVSVDSQAMYTDNMLYQEHGKQDAGLAVTSLEGALTTPACITRFAAYRAEVGYRHQFFNYFGNDNVARNSRRTFSAEDFDFDSSTVFGSLSAQTKHYQFSIGADYTRLLGFEPLRNDNYDEFYSEIVPRWSVQRNIRLCDWSMISLAYLGSYHFTDENAPMIDAPSYFFFSKLDDNRSERWEHTFLAALTVALPHDVAVQPFYRYQFNDFVNTDSYKIHTVGFAAGWYPCANFALRGFVGYNWSDSSDSRAIEYSKLDAGGGVNVTLRF